MSLITRCPACGTLFKLVPDQLRISSGWVRCGQCQLVFDARLHMLSDADAVAVEVTAARQTLAARAAAAKAQTPDLAVHAAPPPPPSTPLAPASVPPPPKAEPKPAPKLALKPHAPVSAPPPKPRQEAEVTPAEIARWRDERLAQVAPKAGWPDLDAAWAQEQEDDGLEVRELEMHFGDLHEILSLSGKEDAAPAKKQKGDAAAPAGEPEKPAQEDEVESALSLPEEALSFVREARRRAFWHSAPMRALLWLLLVLLAAALALQVAVTWRDWLAAAYPATEPALRLLCRAAGCEVGPYRHLEGMAVDSSSFTRVTGNVYQLAVTLRNNAALPVAMPAFDLTLSDMQGQPVLRRVIAPAELGAPAMLAAGGEFAGTARLTLAPLPDSAAVIGYRVEAFYP